MIDLSKYANKGVEVDNEDFKLERLEKDLLKGYVKESEIEKPDYSSYVNKADFEKLQSDYSSLENNYNETIKKLDETNDNMSRVSLEGKMYKFGFEEKDFVEVAKLRKTIYEEEKDDTKALENIATRYKGTFFKEDNAFTPAPTDTNNMSGASSNQEEQKITINRKTKISDLILK